jgi:hypothetical protein
MLLSDLIGPCGTFRTAFDAATMRPKAVEIGVLTDRSATFPFDFCITQLEFLP